MRAWISTFFGKSLGIEHNSKRKRELARNLTGVRERYFCPIYTLSVRNKTSRLHLPEGGEGLLKFRGIEFPVTVEIHAVKDDPESADSNSTLLLNSKLELKVKFTHHNILVDTVESHRDCSLRLKIIYDFPLSHKFERFTI